MVEEINKLKNRRLLVGALVLQYIPALCYAEYTAGKTLLSEGRYR
jgi:hypothetical protein